MFKLRFHSFRGASCALLTVGASILCGCASVGTPGGGLYDETPPSYRSSRPAQGATQVHDRKISIHFDENIKLNNVMDQLVVSPPQAKTPTVLSNGKTVTVELLDTLLANTTYTLDFGSAIQDNNEGNTLEHFDLTFSTGDHIDSLRIGGYLLNAADLEPITGAYVGLYPDSVHVSDTVTLAADSAFRVLQMPRAGRSDALGAFTISGVAPGRYWIYALMDGNSNYRYDLFSEDIAFLDTIVVPSVAQRMVSDTLWTDTLGAPNRAIDTILTHEHSVYEPSNLRLFLFNEGRINRYMDDYARPDSARLTFRFSGEMPSLPELRLLGDAAEAAGDTLPLAAPRLYVEASAGRDTLTYWLADSALYRADTLRMAVTYTATDTALCDRLRTDTLTFLRPAERKNADSDGGMFSSLRGKGGKGTKGSKGLLGKKSKDKEAAADSVPPIVYMTLKSLLSGDLDIGRRPRFEASAPLADLDTAGLHLELKVDSLWKPMDFRWEQDSTNVRRYQLSALPHFTPGSSYRLTVDSAAMHDVFGAPVAKTTVEFRERKPEDYAHLLFRVRGVSGPAFVQLLDAQDRAVYQAPVSGGQAKLVHVSPGTYYARLVADTNGNGRFDGGSLAERRQPEQVYYFPSKLELRANWQFSQDWDVTATDRIHQKPEDVKKNKPKAKEEKKSRNEEYKRQHNMK